MPIVRPVYNTMKQIFEIAVFKNRLEFPQGGFGGISAPGMWSLVFLSQPPSARSGEETAARRARLGLHAVHAQPDDRLLLLRQAQGPDRARHDGRKRDDAVDLRRHGAAGRRAQKKLAVAGGHRESGTGQARKQKPSSRLARADQPDRLVLAEKIEQMPQALRRARVASVGSRDKMSAASSRAAPRYLPCTSGRASWKPGRPLWRVPSTSPSPRRRRSSSAMRKPSSVSRRMASRALAVSPSGAL